VSWLLSLVVSFLTGVLGLACGVFLGDAYVRWYRVSSFEGEAGYAMIGIALLSGLAGLVVGLVAARGVAAGAAPGFLKALGAAWGVYLALAGVLASFWWLRADIRPRIDGNRLMLEVELELPRDEGGPPTAQQEDARFELGSVVRHVQRKAWTGTIRIEEARLEDGRWVVPAEVPLQTMRGDRLVVLKLDGLDLIGFVVPLPARPGRRFEAWSGWGPQPAPGEPPWPENRASYRYRVRQIPPSPPPPTAEEIEAERLAAEEAELRAMPRDAPIRDWLRYTAYGTPPERLAVALDAITGRAGWIDELTELFADEDVGVAAEAMRLVAQLPDPTAELVPPIEAAGRSLADRIRAFNASTVEQDPSYEGAARVSILFGGWMQAVRTLRERCGGDFTPELGAVLELSRERPDSIVMRSDVRRVASYWMKEWAGVEPHPDDPPPR
jgi:hypothetical protein